MPEITSYPVSYVMSVIEESESSTIESGYPSNSSILFAAVIVGVIIIGITLMSFTNREKA